MLKFRFEDQMNQKIVDGILEGYKSYVAERNEKNSTMRVSDAYAWVKGNHIDHETAVSCEEIGIVTRKSKAGYTWKYLQFLSEENKFMFVIKNAKYFNIENFPGGRTVTGKKRNSKNDENYLKQLSRINNPVEFPVEVENTLFSDTEEILSIFDETVLQELEENEFSTLQAEFEKFYIVTYEIDEAHMISSIRLYMPNPHNDVAYLVQDLTEYITSSDVSIDPNTLDVLENDMVNFDYDDPRAIDYGVRPKEEIKKKDENEN